MRLLHGKWFVAVHLKNDLCLGVGKPSNSLKAQADLSRKHSRNI